MITVTSIMFFTSMIFPDPTESASWQHTEDAVHPIPIELHVHHYESPYSRGRPIPLPETVYPVGTDENRDYVIGLVSLGCLFPFMAPSSDLPNAYERVKIRINGNNANETVPISREDPLNMKFFQEFDPNYIRPAFTRE